MSNSTILDDGSNDAEQTSTFAVGGFVVVLAIISVVLRIYVRITTRVGLGWDDWFILASVVLTLLTAALLLWANAADPNGAVDSVILDPTFKYSSADILYTQLSFSTSVLYFSIAGSTKLGILLMYNRIFSMDKAFRYQLAAGSFLAAGWWLSCTIASLTNCIPLEYTWINALDDPRYCFNFNIFWMASGVCEVVIDTIILALPVRAVQKLNLSRQRKATIACIFLLGGFVIITGLIKVILGYVPGEREPSFSRTEVWTTVHTGMAIVCASLPLYKPLITRVSNSAYATKLMASFHKPNWSWPTSWRSRSGSTRLDSRGARIVEFDSETELRRLGSQ